MNVIRVNNLNLFYGKSHILKDINLEIKRNRVTAIIGASGSGKSSFLKSLNRMNEEGDRIKVTGEITYNHIDIYKGYELCELRKNISIVFQKMEPLPCSIYANIEYGLKIKGVKDESLIQKIIMESLYKVGLYDEVKHRLNEKASLLSIGQQQRLCIARALALEPEVILMDEPTESLDPKAKSIIEDLIESLKNKYTIVLVSHDMEQVKQISDYVVVLNQGEVEEYGPTYDVFDNTKSKYTKEYISIIPSKEEDNEVHKDNIISYLFSKFFR